jgi:UDP-N-acetylmuramyl pentapeptide phosphotransferase/UDP-N-acetylglucosamine-1-phosphate transferase
VTALIAAAAFVLSAVTCQLARRLAARGALLDTPNERSLHTIPVPRLGGTGVVVGALPLAAALGVPAPWLGATALIAALGLLDDLRPLPAAVRFAVQVAIVAGFVAWLGAPARVLLVPGVALAVPAPVTVLFLVAALNIYNFMDGMDGLAGTQAVGAGGALAVACAVIGHDDLALAALLLAAASGGFLVHNLPPARLFLGDAGSTALGFGLPALGLLAARRTPAVPFATVAVALAPFLLDGTFTILRRARRLEPIWRAHRSHLYQRAVQAGRGHRDVLVVYAAWVGASAAAAVAVAAGPWPVTAAAAVGSLAALFAVRAWVLRLEAG